MDKKVRVRFAPSPTGPLHCGGVRTAFFNYLFAKRHGGDFLLRVEDTDSEREVDGAVDYIVESFKWLGIMPNEGYGIGGDHGPYIQSERKDIYKKYVDILVESDNAYYAFDTKDELEAMRVRFEAEGVNGGYTGVVRQHMKNSTTLSKSDVDARMESGEPYVIRFKIPRAENIKFKDEVRGWVTFNTRDLDDKVIWKSSDGLPTYHLANVIDDHLMEITHVIRGEEWVPATPLHVLLYKAFGWDLPVYAHLPLILGEDGKKLSKRHGDIYGYPIFPLTWDYVTHEGKKVHVTGFKDEGYESDALLNFIVLLGWNPKNNVEFMSIKEMAEIFSLEGINKAGAMFDKKKLHNFNAHYVRSRDRDDIINMMSDMPMDFFLDMDYDKLDMISKGAVERAIFAKDLKGSLSYLYNTPTLEGEFKMKNVDEFTSVMSVFISDDFIGDWTSISIKEKLESISEGIGLGVGKIMPMLRIALTGGEPGPQLPDVMYIIGEDESVSRIKALLNKIKELA